MPFASGGECGRKSLFRRVRPVTCKTIPIALLEHWHIAPESLDTRARKLISQQDAESEVCREELEEVERALAWIAFVSLWRLSIKTPSSGTTNSMSVRRCLDGLSCLATVARSRVRRRLWLATWAQRLRKRPSCYGHTHTEFTWQRRA